MNKAIAFETDSFAYTKEVWKAASKFLGLDNKDGRIQISRVGTNHIKIVETQEAGGKNPFETPVGDSKLKVIAEFTASSLGNKKVWMKR